MNSISKLISTTAAVALVASAGAALAQARAPAPAAAAPAAQIPTGPAIPGVCIFSGEATVGNSAVGKYVIQRMQQLQSAANAEVTSDKTGIETDARALDAQRASLSSDVVQQRTLSLQQRVGALQRKAEQRSRELEATQQKALARVATEFNPLVLQVFRQHNCSLLLDQGSVLIGNPSMDLTPEVVRLLDAKITQFPFERERLDQPAAAPTAAPAAPPATRR